MMDERGTFVVISAVFALEFQCDRTIGALPALVAAAAPAVLRRRFALSVFAALFRAAFEGTVAAVPAGYAQTCAILALAMLVTAAMQ